MDEIGHESLHSSIVKNQSLNYPLFLKLLFNIFLLNIFCGHFEKKIIQLQTLVYAVLSANALHYLTEKNALSKEFSDNLLLVKSQI